ncbi:MAG: threonine ammonia-lyase [Endozoicomonas sp.]
MMYQKMDATSARKSLPSLSILQQTHELIRPYIRTTPLLNSEALSNLVGGKVIIKPESLQVTGAFKFRGALFRLMSLSEAEKKQGVAAYSSGNFARGLATAGRLLRVRVHLVMPADAPRNKIDNARKEGAEVLLCRDSCPSREEAAAAMAAQFAKDHNHVLLHPFDDPLIILGQSSVAVELLGQLKANGLSCDNLLCPVGGGSLIAGSSLVFTHGNESPQLYAIEPEGYAGMLESIAAGRICRAPGHPPSKCDALQARSPGQANFDIVSQTSVMGIQVAERYIQKAVRMAFEEQKLVLEPSGAIGLAALLQYPDKFRGMNTAVIATGGNIDREFFARLLVD